MATLNTATFDDFVSLEKINWKKQQGSLPQTMRNSGLFKVDNWGTNVGSIRKYDEIDAQEYAKQKDEGDDAEMVLFQEGYEKSVSPYRYALETQITWEMRNRNKYTELVNRLTNLRGQIVNRLDLDLSHRLTFGTATSYTTLDGESRDISVGDGLALFSTSHTLRGSSTTYRNRLAGNPQVSKGSIEAMEKLIVEETLNQFGEKMTVGFDVIWTTDDPNTINTVREYLQSTAEVSAPNAGVVNVYKGKYRHVSGDRIATDAAGTPDSDKAKYWGLASSEMSTAYLSVEEEARLISPQSGMNSEDIHNDDWTFSSRGSWAICIVGAKWIKFSSGDGAA